MQLVELLLLEVPRAHSFRGAFAVLGGEEQLFDEWAMVADIEHLDEVELAVFFPGEDERVEHVQHFYPRRDVFQPEGDAVALVADEKEAVVGVLVHLLYLFPGL